MIEKMISTKDGSHLVYKVIGTGPALIFLHGNSQNNNYFNKQIAFFKGDFQLFLVDSRDHGKSRNSQSDLTFAQLVADLNELMTVEQLTECGLIGFSDGANIALTFAAQYPTKVRQLVLASPNLTVSGLKKGQYLKSRLALQTAQLLKKAKLKRVLSLGLAEIPVKPDAFKTLTCPVLIIGGSNDIITPQHFVHLGALFPNAHLRIAPKTGHSVPRQRAQWFNQTVAAFLSSEKN